VPAQPAASSCLYAASHLWHAQQHAYSSSSSAGSGHAPPTSTAHLAGCVSASAEVAGQRYTFETGALAHLAPGAVLMRAGNNTVLATVCVDTDSTAAAAAAGDGPQLQVRMRRVQGPCHVVCQGFLTADVTSVMHVHGAASVQTPTGCHLEPRVLRIFSEHAALWPPSPPAATLRWTTGSGWWLWASCPAAQTGGTQGALSGRCWGPAWWTARCGPCCHPAGPPPHRGEGGGEEVEVCMGRGLVTPPHAQFCTIQLPALADTAALTVKAMA